LNWNGGADTHASLDAILTCDYPNLQVIVVDNGSSVKEVESVTCEFGDEITLIEMGTNRGYAAGNNAGIKVAMQEGARFVLLLNNDAVVEKKTISELIVIMEMDPSIAICGPTVLKFRPAGAIESMGGRLIPPLAYSFLLKGEQERTLAQTVDETVDFVSGCAMLVRVDAISSVGLLDEEYFLYSEDTDWCLRMSRAGWGVAVCRGANVRHMGGRSTSRVPLLMEQVAHSSRARFFLKNFTGWVRMSAIIWLFIWTTWTFFQYVATKRLDFAVAAARGLLIGLLRHLR
jgi:GT2 family glycosyltransferase